MKRKREVTYCFLMEQMMMNNERNNSPIMNTGINEFQDSQGGEMAVNYQVEGIMSCDYMIKCEPCNAAVHKHSLEQHNNGKKHLARLDQYNKEHNTIFILGVRGFNADDLERIFVKYGEILSVSKQINKVFGIVTFKDKSSVAKAIKAQVYARGKKLVVRKFEPRNNNMVGNNENSRKLSDASSNSQTEISDKMLGVPDLPFELPDPDLCPDNGHFFEWQVQQFISQVELSTDRYQQLTEVINDMTDLFDEVIPGCRVLVFGSCATGLAFKNSDVDLFLQPNGEPLEDFVRRQGRRMFTSRHFAVKARVPKARVPIIKFVHLKTGWEGDLTANSQLGVCNSKLIRFLTLLDPRIRPLIMVIKYWAKVCGLSGTPARFTPYSIVILVIFYLQQLEPPILPPVCILQKMAQHKTYTLGWESSFCDEEWLVRRECLPQLSTLSLRELLTGFFRFYYNLDFNNVICPLTGKTLPLKNFESDDGKELPEEMYLYKEKLKSDPSCKFKTNTILRVQDPFELCLNITRNVTDAICLSFKEACKVSLQFCEKEEENNLLKNVFSISTDILQPKCDGNIKIYIPMKLNSSESVAEKDIVEWYNLTLDSILLVLSEIYKMTVEPKCLEQLPKVKKLETSQDVHNSTVPYSNSERLTYICSCSCDVTNCRKKVKKLPAIRSVLLSGFEKEVIISNALYIPGNISFSFTMSISSLEELKRNQKGIEITFEKKKSFPFKVIFDDIKRLFKNMIAQAAFFIKKVKETSSEIESDEALKDMYKLKLKMLPNVKEIEERTVKNVSKIDGPIDKNITAQKIQGAELLNIEKNIEKDAKSVAYDISSEKNCPPSLNPNISNVREGKFCIKSEKTTGERHNENEIMKTVISSENMPSSETQALIDNFFKPKTPDQMNIMKSTPIDLGNNETDRFSDLLQKIQSFETCSTFASQEVNNPFLASIEKVALKSSNIVNNATFQKYDQLEDKTRPNNIALPSNTNENIEEREEITENLVQNSECLNCDTIINDDKRNNLKSTLHRPNTDPERPTKHKKPNRHANNSSICHSSTQEKAGANGYGFQGDGSELKSNPNSIERQKVWYPSLFKPKNL